MKPLFSGREPPTEARLGDDVAVPARPAGPAKSGPRWAGLHVGVSGLVNLIGFSNAVVVTVVAPLAEAVNASAAESQ